MNGMCYNVTQAMSNTEMFWILAIYLVIIMVMMSWSIMKFIMDTEDIQNIRRRARKRLRKGSQ